MADDTHWKMLLCVLSVLAMGLQYTSGFALPKIQIPSNLLPGSEVTRLKNIGQSFKLDDDGSNALDAINSLFDITEEGILKTKNYLDHLSGTGFVVQINHRTDSDSWQEAINIRIGGDAKSYEGFISENNQIGDSVFGLKDLSESLPPVKSNSQLSLTGDGSEHFHVQKNQSGIQIIADDVLDHEDVPEYDLVLTSSTTDDHTSDEVSVLIHISVLNKNEKPPIFASEKYNFAITETASVGTVTGTVRAHDEDEESTITYATSSGNDYFRINPQSGEIIVDQPLSAGRYVLLVSAIDDGIPPLSAPKPATVTIDVLPVDLKLKFHPYGNDMLYPPAVQYAAKSRSKRATLEDVYLTLEETMEVDAVIHTVPAEDEADRFALNPPNERFTVGEMSGEVTIVKSLDFETFPNEVVEIRITNLNNTRKYCF